MDPEFLKLLIPLGFFVFWAITKISEKNVKPLELRGSPPPPQGGMRSPTGPNAPTLRWDNQPAPGGIQSLGRNDEIIILGENRPQPRVTPQPRRAKDRSRVNQSQGQKPAAKPARARKLGEVEQGVSQRLADSALIAPMSVASMPLIVTSASAASPGGGNVPTSPNALGLGIQSALKDPARIRESILINEILQPPISVRNRRHPRI